MVAGCCDPTDYRRLFSRKSAARDARRFRRRGLTGTARALVELAGEVSGATVLDVGGGIGAIELVLLAAGAERATNVEISGGYEEQATALLAERASPTASTGASPTSSPRAPRLSRTISSCCTASSAAIPTSTR